MDINSTGSTITKKRVDLWTLKAEEINLLNRNNNQEDTPKKELDKKENEQLSFASFIEDFKI